MHTSDFDEVNRLNRYLDELARGEPASPSPFDQGMARTIHHLRELADRSTAEPRLQAAIWEDMMNRAYLPGIPTSGVPISTTPTWPLDHPNHHRFRPRSQLTLRRLLAVEVAAVALVLLTLGAGLLAYWVAPGHGEPESGAPAVAEATPASSGAEPVLAGCETEPRREGSAAALAGSMPTNPGVLPRFGPDPFRIGIPHQAADGAWLFSGDAPPEEAVAGIEETLDQLVSCRFYVEDGNRYIDADGRFFGLYSDDFLQRELAGYAEAELLIAPMEFWMPPSTPSIQKASLLEDGRIAALFAGDTGFHAPKGERFVAIFAKQDERWLVDELGYVEATDVVIRDEGAVSPASADDGEVSGAESTAVLDIALYDSVPGAPVWMDGPDSPQAEEMSCNQIANDATPLPCGEGYATFFSTPRHDLPADTEVTLRLHNAGTLPHRFLSDALRIDVEVMPGERMDVTVTAPAGEYLFTISEGADPMIVGAGVLTFVPAGSPRGAG